MFPPKNGNVTTPAQKIAPPTEAIRTPPYLSASQPMMIWQKE